MEFLIYPMENFQPPFEMNCVEKYFKEKIETKYH